MKGMTDPGVWRRDGQTEDKHLDILAPVFLPLFWNGRANDHARCKSVEHNLVIYEDTDYSHCGKNERLYLSRYHVMAKMAHLQHR